MGKGERKGPAHARVTPDEMMAIYPKLGLDTNRIGCMMRLREPVVRAE